MNSGSAGSAGAATDAVPGIGAGAAMTPCMASGIAGGAATSAIVSNYRSDYEQEVDSVYQYSRVLRRWRAYVLEKVTFGTCRIVAIAGACLHKHHFATTPPPLRLLD